MTPAELQEKYDFTESTILAVEWRRQCRDVVITLDYYWDFSDPEQRKPGPSVPMELRLIGVTWIRCILNVPFARSDQECSEPTIIGWGIDRDIPSIGEMESTVLQVGSEFHFIFIQIDANARPARNWLEAICRDVEVVVKSEKSGEGY